MTGTKLTPAEIERQKWVKTCNVAIQAAKLRMNKDAVQIIQKIIELRTMR